MKFTQAMKYTFLPVLLSVAAAFCQPPPIIDVHLHAEPVNEFGEIGLATCPGDAGKSWPAANPGSRSVTRASLEACPNPIRASRTDEELLAATKALLEKYNITGVLSGSEELVSQWTASLGNRIIPGIYVPGPGTPPLARLRELADQKKLRVMGEVLLQYTGLSPADPAFEPYWALAEELDVPVGIHIGPGPAGGVEYWGQKNYRVSLTDPVLLETVLIRHPRLRVYIMHAGWPMIDRMIHMLYTYPRLYVDTGLIDWYLPRKEFHQYLRRLVEAGFGSRILFGSDQMIWPQAIEIAIQSIESADFLTPQQKRDIFYNNATRFLGITTPENVRTFWDQRFRRGTQDVEPGPSRLLVTSIEGRKPGAALDLGMGEGRNAIYLVSKGWAATGVDISPVAVGRARASAATQKLKLEAIAADLDSYDLGKDRWDLITSFYMQDWHANSKTDIPARIYDALKPGGMVIIEGFGPPRLKEAELRRSFGRMRILLSETVDAEPEWGRGQKRRIVRFVAEKSR